MTRKKKNVHGDRVAARKTALQVIYQSDILDQKAPVLVEEHRLVPETQGLDDYALRLIEGISEHCAELDERIVAASQNWALDRMPIVDRSLLRLATFEMIFVSEVPVSVSINEAVNLAKEFGGDDSPRFVNGILGRIAAGLGEAEE